MASVEDASLPLAASLSAREETRDAEIVEEPVRVGSTAVAFPTTEAKLEESWKVPEAAADDRMSEVRCDAFSEVTELPAALPAEEGAASSEVAEPVVCSSGRLADPREALSEEDPAVLDDETVSVSGEPFDEELAGLAIYVGHQYWF